MRKATGSAAHGFIFKMWVFALVFQLVAVTSVTAQDAPLFTTTMDRAARIETVKKLAAELQAAKTITGEQAILIVQACEKAAAITPGKTGTLGTLASTGAISLDLERNINDRLFGKPGAGESGGQVQTAPAVTWIDPDTTAPNASVYILYSTPTRGSGTQGSALVYLPESYKTNTTKRYPVIYFLHGGFGNQHEGATVSLPGFSAAMKTGTMPETIIVVPHAIPSGWYCNSKDGSRPVEDVLIKDLVPHIDQTYRTISSASARGIEGMSMGGFGALHLGLKYPGVFGVISAVGPSINPNLSDEPAIRTQDTFFDDAAYYTQNTPQTLAGKNAATIIAGKVSLRILAGSDDGLKSTITDFDALLSTLKINHLFAEAQGAGHDYTDILAKLNFDPYLFWADALKVK